LRLIVVDKDNTPNPKSFEETVDQEFRRYFAHIGPEASKMVVNILAAHTVEVQALQAEWNAAIDRERAEATAALRAELEALLKAVREIKWVDEETPYISVNKIEAAIEKLLEPTNDR
jgi:hypothetical protein